MYNTTINCKQVSEHTTLNTMYVQDQNYLLHLMEFSVNSTKFLKVHIKNGDKEV